MRSGRRVLGVLALALALAACGTFAGLRLFVMDAGVTTSPTLSQRAQVVAITPTSGERFVVLAQTPTMARIVSEDGLDMMSEQPLNATVTALAPGVGKRFFGLTDGGTRVRRWDLDTFHRISPPTLVANLPLIATDLTVSGDESSLYLVTGRELRRYAANGAFLGSQPLPQEGATLVRPARVSGAQTDTLTVAQGLITSAGNVIRVSQFQPDLTLIGFHDMPGGSLPVLVDFEVSGLLSVFERSDGFVGGALEAYFWHGPGMDMRAFATRTVELRSHAATALSSAGLVEGFAPCGGNKAGAFVWRARSKPVAFFGQFTDGHRLEQHTMCADQ